MGNDGGSIPDRRDLVRTKAKAEQADKANQTRARWFFCALSKRRLEEPIVACPLGRLFNKDALLEFLLDRASYGADGAAVAGHIRSLKDVKELKLTANPATKGKGKGRGEGENEETPKFVCPLTFKEMNGAQPFAYLAPCGCVFSLSGLKSLSSAKEKEPGKEGSTTPEKDEEQLELCPQCGAKYSKSTDIIPLNPSPDDESLLRARMEAKRAAEPKKSKKRKAADPESSDPPKKKKSSPTAAPTVNPNIAATSRAVVTSLALEEAKRKAGMSDAVKSLYGDPSKPKQKETFTTMGTFTRYA
ncbi:DUF602-domain-containing protein [Gloeophyllum trabeum ATCC 11539]|uniref:DUF602-domain-containing protein n=1 Tax=Gloeophyllum trabeum (strain ATCC 11539 / FP-39264 / Madison 617) TaxID=670483 RepID=S7S5N1_GLOTA|nr:DUF602-domain-containing protein [Gloeophyllum trabeum ATCC 11539]EPQ61309.1 DUF602-domain-containing protein [Gloeophyllum trabeum ATCC 11539]